MVESFPKKRLAILIVAAATMTSLWAPAAAQEEPTAAEITEAVSDHTYQGAMSKAGSGFAEYYAPDGSIRGDGYTGKWRAAGGTMCFQYGDKPEKCFGITINGPSMVMLKDGEIQGNGMLIPGNPNDF